MKTKMSSDLYLSPKFSYFLNQKGQLDPLIIAFQEFREQQNYPFELKDKRIAIQSVFKGLCELYASQGFNQEKPVSSEEILEEAKDIVKSFWEMKEGMWEKRPTKESTKMIEEKIEEVKKDLAKGKKTYVLDIKGKGKTKDFHAECLAKTKEEAYQELLKTYPALTKQKKEIVLKTIELKK